jgi:hypothetical protein
MAVEDAVKVGEFELKGIGLWRLTMWSDYSRSAYAGSPAFSAV